MRRYISRESMYHIFESTLCKEYLSEWGEIAGDFDLIKGYTELGDVFLINSKTNEIGILFPLNNAIEPMGYTDWTEFSDSVLNNLGFQEEVVRKEHLEQVSNHCDKLGQQQIYYAVPLPFVGGSGAPETYEIGDLWVYLSIAYQSLNEI